MKSLLADIMSARTALFTNEITVNGFTNESWWFSHEDTASGLNSETNDHGSTSEITARCFISADITAVTLLLTLTVKSLIDDLIGNTLLGNISRILQYKNDSDSNITIVAVNM